MWFVRRNTRLRLLYWWLDSGLRISFHSIQERQCIYSFMWYECINVVLMFLIKCRWCSWYKSLGFTHNMFPGNSNAFKLWFSSCGTFEFARSQIFWTKKLQIQICQNCWILQAAWSMNRLYGLKALRMRKLISF